MRRLTVLILLLTATLAAQTPVRDGGVPIAPPSGTAGLSGVVKDGDNNPLRRALVVIRGDMSLNRTVVADDLGRFAFTKLPAGRFTITASKPGYPAMSYGAKKPLRTGPGMMLTEGQQVSGLTLTVPKGAVLTGTVYDDRGRPMPGVPVMAWEYRTGLSGERTVDMPSTGGESVTTDDRGVYRVFGLPPGEYTVGTAWFYHGSGSETRVPSDAEIRAAFDAVTRAYSPSSTPPAPPSLPVLHDFVPVYAPDVTDPMTATTITLGPGEERTGIDLRMQFSPRCRVEITTVGPDGRPVSAEIEFSRGRGTTGVTSVSSTNADGKYAEGSLSPGEYTVRAQTVARGDQPALWAAADVMVAGTETATLQLLMQPAMSASGRVIFEGTTLPQPDVTKARVNLNGLQRRSVSDAPGNGVVDATGQFSIRGISPGSYRVSGTAPVVSAPGGPAWRVRTVTYGGRDVTDLPIDIASGETQPIVVTFTDLVSELTGTLTDAAGKPATDYFVVVLPADKQYWYALSRRIVSARPGADGRFVFRGLPDGQYLISATTDLVTRDLQDQAALAQIAAVGQPLTLTVSEKKTFDIKLR
jgi:protocatechuate 3,4-dioxygenase beta subunit